MSIIASGYISLSAIDDAYSVTLTPNNCVINSSYDGSGVDLDNAFSDIRVFRGNSPEAFSIRLDSISDIRISYSVTDIDSISKRVRITSIPNDSTGGWISFIITTAITSHVILVTINFSVMREATMLDWILDWESNKTTIGSTYLITPKIFVGKRIGDNEGLDSLCGVYIGPDGLEEGSSGIYGLKFGEEIFKLNKDGGKIGSWNIGADYLFSSHVLLASSESYIGVSPFELTDSVVSLQGFSHRDKIHEHGGVAMFYSSSNDFGFEGYLPSTSSGGSSILNKIFSLGNENKIASWNFDTDSLWIGNKANTANSNTLNSSSITIGTNGLRGYKWRLESNGAAEFSGGKVSFAIDGSGFVANHNIVWDANGNIEFAGSSMELTGAIYVKDRNGIVKAGILSDGSGASGIRFFAGSSTPSSAPFRVDENGLLYASDVTISGTINADDGSVGCWTIDSDSLYKGTKAISGFTSSSGYITIGSTGIRGYKWRIESNGIAAFANGNVLFNADGSGSVANNLVSWTSAGALTIGGANGTTLQNDMLLTGGIKVKKNGVVKAGMLADGSGVSGIRFFAGSSTPSSAPFRVDENGLVTATNAVVSGQITASSGYIGNWMINTAANGGTIVSDNAVIPKVTLDAGGSIRLYTNEINTCIGHMVCGGEGYSRGIGSDIKLDADLGVIQIKSVGNVAGSVSEVLITPTGIYADRAGMEAPTTGTYTQRAAIVGDGTSTLIASSHDSSYDENCIIGVYGSASNTRTSSAAPSYGGFFDGLKVRGLYLGRRLITSIGTTQLDGKDSLVICYPPANGGSANIYLPIEGAYEGRTIMIKLLNNGDCSVYPGAGSYMNSTTNTNPVYLGNGETWIFVLVKLPTSASTYVNVWTSTKSGQQ